METRIKTRIFLLLSVLFLTPALALTQGPTTDVNRQDALDLLKSLARSLKSEPDKLAAARIASGLSAQQLQSGNEATLEAIDFSEIRSLASQDYMQARLLATKLEQPVQRANYLTAVAASVIR